MAFRARENMYISILNGPVPLSYCILNTSLNFLANPSFTDLVRFRRVGSIRSGNSFVFMLKARAYGRLTGSRCSFYQSQTENPTGRNPQWGSEASTL